MNHPKVPIKAVMVGFLLTHVYHRKGAYYTTSCYPIYWWFSQSKRKICQFAESVFCWNFPMPLGWILSISVIFWVENIPSCNQTLVEVPLPRLIKQEAFVRKMDKKKLVMANRKWCCDCFFSRGECWENGVMKQFLCLPMFLLRLGYSEQPDIL